MQLPLRAHARAQEIRDALHQLANRRPRGRIRDRLGQACVQARIILEQRVFLGLEVAKEGALGHARVGGDLGRRRAREPSFGEKVERRLFQPRARVGGPSAHGLI